MGEELREPTWADVVDAVRQVHQPRTFERSGTMDLVMHVDPRYEICAECRQKWPCATETAVRGVVGDSWAEQALRERLAGGPTNLARPFH